SASVSAPWRRSRSKTSPRRSLRLSNMSVPYRDILAAAGTAAPRHRHYATGSALGELEAAAGLGFAVLLALDDAAVAGQKALALQKGAQARLVPGQRLADAVTHRPGLARQTAALDRAPHVELTQPIGRNQRLVDQ